MIYSNTPAIDDGATCAQICVGRETLVADVYGMKSDKQFIDTLEDNVHKRGAMDKLISDSAQVKISNKVKDFCEPFVLMIGSWNLTTNIKTFLRTVGVLSKHIYTKTYRIT